MSGQVIKLRPVIDSPMPANMRLMKVLTELVLLANEAGEQLRSCGYTEAAIKVYDAVPHLGEAQQILSDAIKKGGASSPTDAAQPNRTDRKE